MVIIPIISSICYLLGGQVNKWYRWLMGVPIFIIAILNHYSWTSVFAIASYLIATNAFSYGDNMWTTKLFGKWASMAISGFAFGLASYCVLPLWLAMVQTIIATISFVVIKWLDDSGYVKNPFVELLRGGLGCIAYIGG